MQAKYVKISESWVAIPPDPIAFVEFYGGEGFGSFPTQTYQYFLQRLYDAGYAIIAVPFQMGLDHVKIAYSLLQERNIIRYLFPQFNDKPHFWIGHSIGCKIIGLLEAYTEPQPGGRWVHPTYMASLAKNATAITGIYDEPSLLIAPANPSTSQSVQVPILPNIMDMLGIGVRPSKDEWRQLVVDSKDMFGLSALISFTEDTAAGNMSLPGSTVEWLVTTLKQRYPNTFQHKELVGGHLEPNGIKVSNNQILGPKIVGPLIVPTLHTIPRPLEETMLHFLAELGKQRTQSIQQRKSTT